MDVSDEPSSPEKLDIPDGNSSGGVNVEYTYAASTTDHDKEQIYYPFDLDDGDFSGWIAAYNTGETADKSYMDSLEKSFVFVPIVAVAATVGTVIVIYKIILPRRR